jgi:hypothetical protein
VPKAIQFEQLPDRMREMSREFQAGATAIMRGVAEFGTERVVMTTPVDTGEGVSNWAGSVDVPIDGRRPPYNPYPKRSGPKLGDAANTQPTIAAAKAAFALFDASRNHTLYLTNNVPHIALLNDGSANSAQQPANFAARAAQAARQYIAQARRVLIKRGSR